MPIIKNPSNKKPNFSEDSEIKILDQALLKLFQKDYHEIKTALFDVCKGIRTGNLFAHIAKKTGFTFNWDKILKANLKNNMIEILFWEEFIRLGGVEPRKNDKFVLKIDKYNGVIREILNEKIEKSKIFYQIHFEEKNRRKKVGFLGFFDKETYQKPISLRFYVRAIEFSTLNRRIYRYDGENLKEGIMGFRKEFEKAPENLLQKMKEKEKLEIVKKGIQIRDRVFLYKGVLIAKSRFLLSLVFIKGRNTIEIRLLDQRIGREIKKMLMIDAIEGFFPNVRCLLKAEAYKITGDILFKAFKNTLLLFVFKMNLYKNL